MLIKVKFIKAIKVESNFIIFLFSLKEETIRMVAINENSQEIYPKISTRKFEEKFTLAMVCEEAGWRIYFNGEEYDFFYHRFSPQYIKQIRLLASPIGSDWNWRIMKFIWKHTW